MICANPRETGNCRDGALSSKSKDMKLRDFYSSTTMVAGLVCLVLGIGNWTVGSVESSKYQALLRKTSRTGLEETYRSFQELDRQKNAEALKRINNDRQKYNAARAKLNFFFVVLSGGKLLFVIGALLALSATVSLIRRDARINIRKVFGAGDGT